MAASLFAHQSDAENAAPRRLLALMSSIVGHCATGIAAYLSSNRLDDKRSWWSLAVLLFLCVCPDLDYIGLWAFHVNLTPRFTHSLAFGVVAGSIGWLASRRLGQANPKTLPLHSVVVAAVSHPVLDLLVGVHSVPMFWPFLSYEPALPFGVLPSAGLLRLTNPYLWRNLFIECGVLFPVLALYVATVRGVSFRSSLRHAAYLAPVWFIFVTWSVSLTR